LQLLPDLPHLICLCFSAGGRLLIQEARSALEDDMASFRLARNVTDFGRQHSEIVEWKVRVVLPGHKLFKQLFCLLMRCELYWRNVRADKDFEVADRRHRIAAEVYNGVTFEFL
jgi:hypothetical protein